MTEKLRIGVIGAGRWGPNLIRNFHSDPASVVVMVADQSTVRLQVLKERYPDIAVTESADEVFANPAIDAIVICTPTATHHELARKALENGKNVFVEKPLARTVAECDALVALAEKARKILFVGHIFVYNASIQVIREHIRKGDLGKIFHVQITRTNLGPVRNDVSALWDLASHDLSILQYWLGEMPVRVSAVGGRFLSNKLEDTVFATYTFANNLLANIHVSWLNPKKVREITVVGEKKMLVWDDMNLDKPVQIYDKKITIDSDQATGADRSIVDTFAGFRASIHEGETFVPKIGVNEPLAAECKAFLRAVKDPSTSLSTGYQGKLVVQALAATDLSLKENGREISISY
ncbi:MAG: Gfo/Idh/MocA family oxidoreductase [Deltaproteobacteria bacterium]|nr:Gfo/Idh/MocA family oxidoreductase [Deltaproteobacteria bacterium]